jgi:hypothetical protein
MQGADWLYQQRLTLIRDLERSRAEGLAAVMPLLRIMTADNVEQVWPLVWPVLEALILEQQQQGRRLAVAYMGAIGVAAGLGLVTARTPAEALLRDGLLPSGVPVRRLLAAVPAAVGHRVDAGMPAPVAFQATFGKIVQAVNEAAHDEARKTAMDAVKVGRIDWDRKIEDVVAANRAKYPDVVADHGPVLAPRERSNVIDARDRFFGGGPAVTRYIRQPNAGACSWCLMLATKGPVYYSHSWGASNQRFRGDGNARAHQNCRCTIVAEPVPGAYKDVILGDPEWYEGQTWTDKKYKRTYELDVIVARLAQAKQAIAA